MDNAVILEVLLGVGLFTSIILVLVFVILLAPGTPDSQAKDHYKIGGAQAPIYEAQIGHEVENQQ